MNVYIYLENVLDLNCKHFALNFHMQIGFFLMSKIN